GSRGTLGFDAQDERRGAADQHHGGGVLWQQADCTAAVGAASRSADAFSDSDATAASAGGDMKLQHTALAVSVAIGLGIGIYVTREAPRQEAHVLNPPTMVPSAINAFAPREQAAAS